MAQKSVKTSNLHRIKMNDVAMDKTPPRVVLALKLILSGEIKLQPSSPRSS